ncbi:E3 ubiquitin-protein ligase JMJ24 [Magnolia sinica]|uniref:E3 ubiquitin-protein ligase JMJ24 n=1 Tax=Magnolia sinica TaxID=86752 RepID=UPI00265B4253|nr:E3 ubiquitin-protein ligase JMJ24 [Magnolia sinica]XP_058084312.1 E3 ubiquitin-protein ligase JMJ24 [Magnolia sinica]
MDLPISTSGNIDDNVGIPEDLRCKRSDGKQWRCSALSMPDKTVCEKHYIQAKKRAANSALRASLKKAKRKSIDDSDIYLESKNDELDLSLMNASSGEFPTAVSSKRYKEKVPKSQPYYSPDTLSMRSLSIRTPQRSNDDSQRDIAQMDDYQTNYAYKTSPFAVDSSRNKFQNLSDDDDLGEQSSKSTDSSDEDDGPTCHQCRRTDRETVIQCLRCDRKGYCDSCIFRWYPDISLEEIRRVCPACRGICNCKMCLRGDNLIKIRLQEIAGLDKLQYLHHLLSLVLPVLKQIHSEQSFELEVETRAHGSRTDIPRAKIHADELMCCDCCKTPIVDYHRHCGNCFYDLCLACCRDLRRASQVSINGEPAENQVIEKSSDGAILAKQPKSSEVLTGGEQRIANVACKGMLDISHLFPDWKANSDGSILCPPKESGGCGCRSLTLRRILKMNWVAKLVKNAEEMVNGCKVYDVDGFQTCSSCIGTTASQSGGLGTSKLFQCSHREDSSDNFLYCPASQDIKLEGINHFQKHWGRGEPIVVKHVFDCASASIWDPMVIWREIRETADEKMKEDNRIVKAIDCLDWSEVDIELGQFIKGYSEGRIHENGWPEMLKLKSWPPPSALEEFLLYRRLEFISKLPLLEYIHSKWGLLNLAAKLPHASLQADVGPKIFIAYGTSEELGRGDSVNNLDINMGDVVYLLMHTAEVKFQGWQRAKIEKIQKTFRESDAKESIRDENTLDTKTSSDERNKSPDLAPNELSKQTESGLELNAKEDEIMEDQADVGIEITSGETKKVGSSHLDKVNGDVLLEKARAGARWDIFRQQDVPKLSEYLRIHWIELRNQDSSQSNSVVHPIYDQAVFLNDDHKRNLKEEFKIEPWTFEQHVGEAVFVPAGCAFQVRNLQSSVQLGLDFLSPESLVQSVQLAQEIRCLPNDHEAKLQILEVGKMSLYAVSSAIKEIYKLTLDPKMELGFEDRNLTAMVSENIEKMAKRRRITCV